MIGKQMPFLDPTLLLRRQAMKDLAQMSTKLRIWSLPPTFRDEDDMKFAVPDRVT
jgi:hypothetical protein